jgi:cell division septum initiation protein DivIVA
MKPSEARRMRQQRDELKRELEKLNKRAARFPNSWVGAKARDEAKEAREKLSNMAAGPDDAWCKTDDIAKMLGEK